MDSLAHEKHYYVLVSLVHQSYLFEFDLASKCIPSYPLVHLHLFYSLDWLLWWLFLNATAYRHPCIVLCRVVALSQYSVLIKVVRSLHLRSHIVIDTD